MSASASALSGGSTAHPELVLEPEGASNAWLGIVLFIVSEAVMFGAFFAQYFYNRILSDSWPTRAGLPPGFERVPWFPLPIILTVLGPLTAGASLIGFAILLLSGPARSPKADVEARNEYV